MAIYISIYSLMHNGMGSGNYFQDENDVALFINMWIPFCYFLFMYETNKTKKILYMVGLICGLLAIVVSFSRGGFVGLVCVAAVVWLYSPKKILSLVMVVVLAGVVYVFGGEEYWNEMATISETQDGTAEGRILSWQAGWDMFLDHPLGVGGNNFPMHFPDYQSEEFKKNMWGRAAHSLWFTLIPELGIFGIIIYFALLTYNIKDLAHLKKQKAGNNQDLRYLYILSIASFAALAGFFASATFLSVLYYPHYWYLTALIVAMANISRELTKKEKEGDAEQQIIEPLVHKGNNKT
jgi:probable O-glycosylation ligase (exosortase A-associated)